MPGIISRPARSYETDQSAKLSVTDTATSFVAGQTLSSNDDKWLRKDAAEHAANHLSLACSCGAHSERGCRQSPNPSHPSVGIRGMAESRKCRLVLGGRALPRPRIS